MRWTRNARGAASPRAMAALLLVASTVLGALVGILADRTLLRGRPAGRGGPPPWFGGREASRRGREQMAKDLNLTPDQSVAVDSIFADQSRRLDIVRQEMRPRMAAIVDSTRKRIDSVLTAEQRERLKDLREKQKERHRRHEEEEKEKGKEHR